MIRSLLTSAVALSLLATPSLAQKTYATSSNGTLYELDFDAVTWTPIWSTGTSLLFGIAPTDDLNELYITRFNNGLYDATLDTQSLVFKGATSPNMATITRNSDNGQYYATNHQGLYSYDPVNVSATLIGNYGLFGMYALTYHAGIDKFLVANTFDGSLYSVDPATGAPTVIGVHGTVQVSGLWYDEVSGRTFGVTDLNAQGQMLEFDVVTGQATVLATTGVNFVGLGGDIRTLEAEAYCFGDGTSTFCPCGNFGAAGEGCANSTGDGGLLTAGGTTSIGQNDLTCQGANLVPSQAALLFVGNNAVNSGNGILNGDGLRCAGGGIRRLGLRVPDAQGAANWGPGLNAAGAWNAGDVKRLQIWYRDPVNSPCGTTFNLSNGLEVTFSL